VLEVATSNDDFPETQPEYLTLDLSSIENSMKSLNRQESDISTKMMLNMILEEGQKSLSALSSDDLNQDPTAMDDDEKQDYDAFFSLINKEVEIMKPE
jgi:hypothetical protein